MEDSFNLRVDKIFGSLTKPSTTPSPSIHSLWSLTDEEVEKREWNRERGDTSDREENPCSSSFAGLYAKDRKTSQKFSKRASLEDDLDDLDDDDEDEDEAGMSNQDEVEKEDWEVRSSIGLDPTLDHEDEEDEFDKVAVGRENAGERLYMKDITDYGPYLNAHNVVPESFQDHEKDPRANLLAARLRLKEDIEGVGTGADSDEKMPSEKDRLDLKSILKRKEKQSDEKSQKRVRFNPECENKGNEEELEGGKDEGAEDSVMVNSTDTIVEENLLPQATTTAVPDYLRNPNKYIRYNFDTSSDVDEVSNRKAYTDYLDMVKRSKGESSHEEGDDDFPKSVVFIPRRKTGEAAMEDSYEMKQNQCEASKESASRKGFSLGIAAIEAQENEACAMEEDEPEAVTTNIVNSSRKPGRQYRLKVRSDNDSIS